MTHQQYQAKLEIILVTFASRVIDVANNKEDITFGELIDTPNKAICLLNEEAIGEESLDMSKPGADQLGHRVLRNQLRQELKAVIGASNG